MELKSRWRTPLAALGAGAVLFTVGCGANTANGISGTPAQLTSSQAGAPVLVSCEPHQRTLVRQAVVNGAVVSQVECVAAVQSAAYAPGLVAGAQPVYSAYPAQVAQPVYSDIGDARIVPVSTAPARTVARPVRTRQVVYDERPRATRTKTKSAIIIGSSAGVGAGVGAAVGGKKGALIGAAIGGGGAAIWDQVTRRK